MHEELNRKIAEFVGFVEKGSGYIWPDGRFDKAPDFTDPELGIAHLFKWVVPKLKNKHKGLEITLAYGEYRLGIIGGVEAIILVKDLHHKEYSCIKSDPAPALCYAVEKLIDAQVPSEVT